MEYQVDLEAFRGPLDLLLYLVKRDEVDVCDIPISQVAEQFLHYMNLLEMVDVEWAGEFLVMAATLMEIKSKMLLPRSDEAAEEDDDPRLELVRQLIEYKKFKEAAAMLEAQAERQQCRLPRQPEPPARSNLADQPLRAVELWDLVSAFGRLMRETLALQPKQISRDETPIHVYMDSIRARLAETGEATLSSLFTPPRTRGRLLGLFLGLLELIKQKEIRAEQGDAFAEIYVKQTNAERGTRNAEPTRNSELETRNSEPTQNSEPKH